MKKNILIVLSLAILVPQIAFAAWWNPFSWFNNWNFFKKEQPLETSIILPKDTEKTEAKSENANIKPTNTSSLPIAPKNVSVKINPTPIAPTMEVSTNPTNDVSNLQEKIDNLSEQVKNLQEKNNNLEQQVTNLVKLQPEVILDKTVIVNDGSDQAKITIRTVNNDGSVVVNQKIEVEVISINNYSEKETLYSNKNGEAVYYTPTTSTYNSCGSMEITINVNDLIFHRSIGIKNIQPKPYNAPTCA